MIGWASHLIDAPLLSRVGRGIGSAAREGPPVWAQGDLEGNCLVQDGRLWRA